MHKGRTALRTVVVGASSGLGRCIGIGLTQRGSRTALLARRTERLQDAAEEAGPGTIALACDVTSTKSCQSAIAEAASQLGGIDALVYTPAIGPLKALVDTDVETWRKVFDTNVIGAALVTTAAIPHLTATNGVAVNL
jgi:NAD(P)-dependent dehydrogenase (short-subunit alcohol dehydrogenase family)